jgi:hypothetical protein
MISALNLKFVDEKGVSQLFNFSIFFGYSLSQDKSSSATPKYKHDFLLVETFNLSITDKGINE